MVTSLSIYNMDVVSHDLHVVDRCGPSLSGVYLLIQMLVYMYTYLDRAYFAYTHVHVSKGQKEAGSVCEGIPSLCGSVLKDHAPVLSHQRPLGGGGE